MWSLVRTGVARIASSSIPSSSRVRFPSVTTLKPFPNRPLFGWLNSVFNKVDDDRVKEVGPDLAAAEWLLRCGAGVKWSGSSKLTKDYNHLPAKGTGSRIEAIDATEACVMGLGFPHLRGLEGVKEVKLVRCAYLDDEALAYLINLKHLEKLEIISCGNITSAGLHYLKRLGQLKELNLYDLPEVPRMEMLKELQEALPSTKIQFDDAERSQASNHES
ncbi:unnamed protein product [Notodromas monacha]|uniref:Mitochondrial ATP synthase regulatory component factor B n=1 Tax=Notodromas monacha TaxID=399045 RepID=A0A7R9BDJ5_9CRUS|nr:unnamed protein product [Notodromas monacha]CAG0913405.1 unnamed protein product [Notodromas monacha]